METATVQKATLWQNHNFLSLWTSETISQFGSQFTGLALPLTAIIILNANSFELGILNFAGTIPWLLFGLLVGVFYTVSFFVGFLQVFFDVTYQSFLPSLVRRDQLVEGNSKLQASASTAQVTGPTLAGVVISIITAPIAIAIDACSFFASAFALGRIEHEEVIDEKARKTSVRSDIREGLGVVLSDHRLRMIAGSTGTSNFFSTALGSIVLLYMVLPSPAGLGVALNLAGVTAGLIFSVGSIGAIVGVVFATRIARRIGVGPAIVISMVIGGLGAIPYFTSGSLTASPLFSVGGLPINLNMLLIMAGQFLTFIGVVVYNINQVSLRQAIVPIRLQGRMNASMRFLVWGTIPLGALTGGTLGTILGLRTAIGIAVVGGALAFLWVLLSPVRSLREIPESME